MGYSMPSSDPPTNLESENRRENIVEQPASPQPSEQRTFIFSSKFRPALSPRTSMRPVVSLSYDTMRAHAFEPPAPGFDFANRVRAPAYAQPLFDALPPELALPKTPHVPLDTPLAIRRGANASVCSTIAMPPPFVTDLFGTPDAPLALPTPPIMPGRSIIFIVRLPLPRDPASHSSSLSSPVSASIGSTTPSRYIPTPPGAFISTKASVPRPISPEAHSHSAHVCIPGPVRVPNPPKEDEEGVRDERIETNLKESGELTTCPTSPWPNLEHKQSIAELDAFGASLVTRATDWYTTEPCQRTTHVHVTPSMPESPTETLASYGTVGHLGRGEPYSCVS